MILLLRIEVENKLLGDPIEVAALRSIVARPSGVQVRPFGRLSERFGANVGLFSEAFWLVFRECNISKMCLICR